MTTHGNTLKDPLLQPVTTAHIYKLRTPNLR